jgi:hypothetical protein
MLLGVDHMIVLLEPPSLATSTTVRSFCVAPTRCLCGEELREYPFMHQSRVGMLSTLLCLELELLAPPIKYVMLQV